MNVIWKQDVTPLVRAYGVLKLILLRGCSSCPGQSARIHRYTSHIGVNGAFEPFDHFSPKWGIFLHSDLELSLLFR